LSAKLQVRQELLARRELQALGRGLPVPGLVLQQPAQRVQQVLSLERRMLQQ
jgi:hypothetical protein